MKQFIVLVLMGATGLLGLRLPLLLVAKPFYRRDFIQEYLLGRALLAGVNPYLDLRELTVVFLGPVDSHLPHPAPHPPLVTILAAPFALLDFTMAARLWLAFEAFLVVLSLYVILKEFKVRMGWRFVPAAAACFAILPVQNAVTWGQLTTSLLFAIVMAWALLRRGRDVAGGVFVGLAIALKPVVWPLGLLLLLSKNWKALLWSIVAFAVANLAALLLMGWGAFATYYFETNSQVLALYRNSHGNMSLYALAWRIFDGTGGPDHLFWRAPALYPSVALAKLFAVLLPLAALVWGMRLILKAKDFDSRFCACIMLTLVVSPVSWFHYQTWAMLPLAVMWRRVARNEMEVLPVFCLSILAFLPPEAYSWPLGVLHIPKAYTVTSFWFALPTATAALVWLIFVRRLTERPQVGDILRGQRRREDRHLIEPAAVTL